jgi:hypothetical protein
MDYGAAVSQKGYDVKTCDDRFLVYSSAFPVLKIFSSQAATETIPPGNSGDFTVNASTNVFTSTGHGLVNGDRVNFSSSGTLPSPLIDYNLDAIYYIIEKSTNTFKVSTSLGGSEVNITNTGSGTHSWYTDTHILTITHNLGYYAPFFVVYNGRTGTNLLSSYFMTYMAFGNINVKQYANSLDIVVGAGEDGGNAGETLYFTVYLFLDSFDTVAEKNVNTGTSSGASSSDYGLRISKPGYDVKTCTDEQCALSSSFFTQIIHKKGTSTGDVTHNLGYVPSVLAYKLFTTGKGNHLEYFKTQVSTDTLTLDSGSTYYYIIFKQKNN